MLKKHSCPCCSQPLLRHVSFKRSFWFCSHCYQEMPDLANWRETEIGKQHWLSKNLPMRQPINDETLRRKTQVIAEKKFVLPHSHDRSSVPMSMKQQDASTQSELLKSYVAYYVSRGNRIISPLTAPILFKESVYQYWGYHRDFQDFWNQLTSRRDFRELYLEGDVYCFGQFLKGKCTVDECARCNLPIPMPEGHAPLAEGHAYEVPNCNLCNPPSYSLEELDDPESQNQKDKQSLTHIVAIGTSPANDKALKKWFSFNGFQVTFVSHPEDLKLRSLPCKVDLVLIYGSVSEAEGKAWAQEVTRYPQLHGVPIVALSAEAGGGLPWMHRTLGLEDYLLSPQGGDRLAHHLRHLLKPRLTGNTPELYWFPC